MSRIVLVRHGETVWHAENRDAGCSDIALTSKGYSQAERLARWAAAANLTSVWSSTLSRARLTAVPSAKAACLPLQIDERLIDLDFGRGEGLTNQLESQFPHEHAAFKRDPAANYLPGGEDPAHAAGTRHALKASVSPLSRAVPGRSPALGPGTPLIRLPFWAFVRAPTPEVCDG